jgi:hypothetical protein
MLARLFLREGLTWIRIAGLWYGRPKLRTQRSISP